MKEYLPSREFIKRLLAIIIIIAVVFSVYKLIKYFKNRYPKGSETALVIKPDVIQKDANKNGIVDWEESLWGLDPTDDGVKNKEFIIAERAKLARNNQAEESIEKTPEAIENAELSKEFFAVIMSLQASGNLDDTSIKAVSDTLGQKIIAEPIDPVYTNKMLAIKPANTTSIDAYYKEVADLMVKYQDKDMGGELNLIAQGLMRNDPQATALAGDIARSYGLFGREFVKIPVPSTLIDLHLSIANNYERVAQSVYGLTQLIENPIIGMKSLINYKRYSDDLATEIETLSVSY